MITCHVEGDAAADLLERRWFAANNAAVALSAECDVLREVLELADDTWRRARANLDLLEALRDRLGAELAELDVPPPVTEMNPRSRGQVAVMRRGAVYSGAL
jgi:hypothetical protein